MIKMNVLNNGAKNIEVEVLEHMSEIKADHDQFNRFYNKKQMFKFFLGIYRFVDEYEGTKTEEDVSVYNEAGYEPYFGEASGAYTKVGSNSDDIHIAFYKVEDLDKDAIADILDTLNWDSFFVKDDNGQVYFVYVNED